MWSHVPVYIEFYYVPYSNYINLQSISETLKETYISIDLLRYLVTRLDSPEVYPLDYAPMSQ